jgi:hypothetical protein
MLSRGIITFAYGNENFVQQAKALARSLVLHDPSVPRCVVTDVADPELDALFTKSIAYRSEYGSSFRQKLHIDLYSPFYETLFIDSDSLVIRNLDSYWRAFKDDYFAVQGVQVLAAGESDPEHLDVEFLLRYFQLAGLPKFNGGVYYFKASPQAEIFFATARDLLKRHCDLRFPDFRGDGPSDEAIYSTAMAIHGLTVTDMGIGGMWTPLHRESRVTIDVPRGICEFVKRGRSLRPCIIHYAMLTDTLQYRSECRKLELLSKGQARLARTERLTLLVTSWVPWIRRKWRGLKWRFGRLGFLRLFS